MWRRTSFHSRGLRDLSADWPKAGIKPVDHPFRPFADTFTEQQHKFGPFRPIVEAKRKSFRAGSNDKQGNEAKHIRKAAPVVRIARRGPITRGVRAAHGPVGRGDGGRRSPDGCNAGKRYRRASHRARRCAQGPQQRIAILHTADIHAQLYTHDEFFHG